MVFIMPIELTYHEQLKIDNTLKLREILLTMPDFCKDYFRAIEVRSSTKTRISYAYDVRIFFNYLILNNPVYKNYSTRDFTLQDIERVTSVDVEEFQEYLKVYEIDEKQITNTEKGIARKLSALRSFYRYYYRHGFIKNDPMILIDMPKIHDKAIVRLEIDEVAELLDYVENCGTELSGQALRYYEKTKLRDIAILTLLLGTGIRVSECVGLDINDVDFKLNRVKVVRKGGNEMHVYFGEEVEYAIKNYLYNSRKYIDAKVNHENALFLSTQKTRMGIQAIENMVRKYTKQIIPNKKITPHKLRSTYGTNLYKETGDIYLVADVLGHKDVNITKKHYAALDDDRRRLAATAVRLRESLQNPTAQSQLIEDELLEKKIKE